MSAVIVDILAPATSNFNLPEIESVLFTHQFWHHHLVHGTNLVTPASLEGAPNDTLLGNQLCQWSSIGASADSLLLASHLTVHLAPRIGAYVLANHKTNASLVTDPEVAGQNSRANYVVKQRTQFRSPIIGSEMALPPEYQPLLAMFLPASFPSWHLLIRTSFNNTASTGLCASRFQDPPPTIQTPIALLT